MQKDQKVTGLTALFQVGDAVKDCAAADVAPVVRGRWNDSYDGITPYCSVCGHSHRLMVRKPSYCPNCGAKMDLEDENG